MTHLTPLTGTSLSGHLQERYAGMVSAMLLVMGRSRSCTFCINAARQVWQRDQAWRATPRSELAAHLLAKILRACQAITAPACLQVSPC